MINMTRALSGLGLVVVAASSSSAQQANAGARWQAFTGCWSLVVETDARVAAPPPDLLVCVSPTGSADVATLTTISDGKVVSQQSVDASGAEQPVTAKGCTGSQRATWSADGRRLYLRSTALCDRLRTSSSAILSLTAAGEWLDVRGVSAAGDQNVRVARYLDAGIPSSVPAEIASALRDRVMSTQSARVAAGAAIGTSTVLEASRVADSAVVAAWLLERGQRFAINAAALRQLARAGLPASVSDALVAVSYPNAFHLARAEPRDARRDDDGLTGRRVTAVAYPTFDPFGWGYPTYGYGYGYDRYGYQSGRYGYDGFGGYGYNGYGYGGYYGTPVVIVRGGAGSEPQHGQAVKGHGYTQRNDVPVATTGGGAYQAPAPAYNAPPPSTSSPSTASSSSSTGTSAAPERTAHAKP